MQKSPTTSRMQNSYWVISCRFYVNTALYEKAQALESD